ncbi:hypothetical protein, partial [Massilia aurea]|uniref:hypothetical protein n=1 Tax=Massilia aurea TaxID=373040 RepID=UPI0031D4FB86
MRITLEFLFFVLRRQLPERLADDRVARIVIAWLGHQPDAVGAAGTVGARERHLLGPLLHPLAAIEDIALRPTLVGIGHDGAPEVINDLGAVRIPDALLGAIGAILAAACDKE